MERRALRNWVVLVAHVPFRKQFVAVIVTLTCELQAKENLIELESAMRYVLGFYTHNAHRECSSAQLQLSQSSIEISELFGGGSSVTGSEK